MREAVAALVCSELRKHAHALPRPDECFRDISAERVHALRIGTRRCRSALRTFRDLLPAGLLGLASDLKWVADGLGAVRDLDVYEGRYWAMRRKLGLDDASTLPAYDAHLAAERSRVEGDLAALLASPRYLALIAGFDALCAASGARTPLDSDSSTLAEVGRTYVAALRKRVIKRGRRIDGGSAPSDLHELRKDMKRFRYVLELLEPYIERRWCRSRKAAVRLQDVLGEHQDACVSEGRLRAQLRAPLEEVEAASPREWFELGRLAEAERRAASVARKRFAKAWPAFEDAASG